MFGINFKKFDSMTYAILYVNGKVKKEGKGLSFYYFSPKSNIAAIPMQSRDIPFIFNEITKDYQTVSIQGQITYAIEKPVQLVELFDFTLKKKIAFEENFEKLNQRLNNEAIVVASSLVQDLSLKDALRKSEEISTTIKQGLISSEAITQLGIKILAVEVLGVSPTPEMSKALETTTREALQKEADQAIYQRRNFAVEQERIIKESEYNTEIAVQEKKKQVQEKEAEIKFTDQENKRKLREMEMAADLSVEESNTKLTKMRSENMKKEADAKGYMAEKMLEPYKAFDWKSLMAINSKGMDAQDNIAFAFRELAENTSKIENLNISPELLHSLLKNNNPQRKKAQQ